MVPLISNRQIRAHPLLVMRRGWSGNKRVCEPSPLRIDMEDVGPCFTLPTKAHPHAWLPLRSQPVIRDLKRRYLCGLQFRCYDAWMIVNPAKRSHRHGRDDCIHSFSYSRFPKSRKRSTPRHVLGITIAFLFCITYPCRSLNPTPPLNILVFSFYSHCAISASSHGDTTSNLLNMLSLREANRTEKYWTDQ